MITADARRADAPSFERWVAHFTDNRARHAAIEGRIDWDAAAEMSPAARAALIRSFQRFELGEGGDGAHLLRKARGCGEAQQHALRMLVGEEQAHSALFARGLSHLGAAPLPHHWSDGAFTLLRRSLGLRTELMLFLIAEAVAMPYFVVLARRGPDAVIRGIGTRIALDEEHHLAFQIDQLRGGLRSLPSWAKPLVVLPCWLVAVGATAVVVIDHGGALRACGMGAHAYAGAALRSFRRALTAALGGVGSSEPRDTVCAPTHPV